MQWKRRTIERECETTGNTTTHKNLETITAGIDRVTKNSITDVIATIRD